MAALPYKDLGLWLLDSEKVFQRPANVRFADTCVESMEGANGCCWQ